MFADFPSWWGKHHNIEENRVIVKFFTIEPFSPTIHISIFEYKYKKITKGTILTNFPALAQLSQWACAASCSGGGGEVQKCRHSQRPHQGKGVFIPLPQS